MKKLGAALAANPADVTGFARGEHFPKIMDYMISEPTVGTLVIASAGAGNQVDHVIAQRDSSDKQGKGGLAHRKIGQLPSASWVLRDGAHHKRCGSRWPVRAAERS